MKVFFYGLFMDTGMLAKQGIVPIATEHGHVDDYRLVIGERATLIPDNDHRAYGVMMELTSDDVARLYADSSVADYEPETVVVRLADERQEPVVCYNLPAGKVTGTNERYAKELLALAERLNFPAAYLNVIREVVS